MLVNKGHRILLVNFTEAELSQLEKKGYTAELGFIGKYDEEKKTVPPRLQDIMRRMNYPE
jgi:hypothetical protein